MTPAEEGVLLLCAVLGHDEPRPLTMAQFRELGLRVLASNPQGDPLSEVSRRNLTDLGYDPEQADRILALLGRNEQLEDYLSAAASVNIYPITRVSGTYPLRISRHKQHSSPPVLFARGDASLLSRPSVALVGSRKLKPENEAFAKKVGRLAAREQLVLVSGGAWGADRTAQEACLADGGSCIIFVAGRLLDHEPDSHVLYLSEDGFDLPFSPARALHRNGLIHMQGDRTLAAQCTYGSGGTWQGCIDNLSHSWSELFVFDDGSEGAAALMDRGATGIGFPDSLRALESSQMTLF